MASMQGEVRNPSTSSGARGDSQLRPPISYEEIAIKLINEKLLLTALELHAELCEANKELPILRDFFENPNNFTTQNIKPEPFQNLPRSASQATLDSLDMTRFSEDGGGVDERVAVLEFELRKARENISSLRANLTVVTECEGTSPDKGSEKNVPKVPSIKPHEQRALNYLVNEYLLARSCKLTSITFSDENDDQDFEDWQDVGLNIPKPPELLQIYREFMRASGRDKPPSVDMAIQTDSESENIQRSEKNELEEVNGLKGEAVRFEQEKTDFQNILTNRNFPTVVEGSCGTLQTFNSTSSTPEKFELLESPPQNVSNTTQNLEEDSVSVVVSIGETDPGDKDWTRIQFSNTDITESSVNLLHSPSSSRHLPANFRKEVMKHCLIPLSDSVSIMEEPLKDGITKDTLVEILTRMLPRIAPNVILNKREELIPLILSAVRLQSSSVGKDKLLQLLFNLKKKPQEDERRVILGGLVAMARLNNGLTENEEILNLCWEQSQHKYTERRLLAAECCSVLAPFTFSGIRNSLMLSMLQQMLLDDKEPLVRTTVVKSLALLVALMDDPDKYFQCEELAVTALNDVALEVVDAASSVLIPILGQWALSLERLLSHLLPRIIGKLHSQFKSSHPSSNKEQSDGERIVASIGVLQYLLPLAIVCTVDNEIVRSLTQEGTSAELPLEFSSLCHSTMIDPKVFYESDVDVGVLLNTFFINTWENDTWPELEWLTEKHIPELLEILASVNVAQESVLNGLLTYLESLCLGFGRYITRSKIQSVFMLHVDELEKQLLELSSDKRNLSLSLIPAYLIVLSTLDCTELSISLKHFLVALSMSGTSVASLQLAVVRLCRQVEMQGYVLKGLWDGVVHQRPSVKCATAILFGSVIPLVSERLANAKVAPAIITLATDSDVTVRAAAIPILGRLVTECGSKEAREKARLTLETIAREPQGIPSSLAVPLVLTLASIAPNCPQKYVEDVIATQLTGITASALQQTRKIELASALIDAYSVLVYCPLSNQCVSGVLLPGLKYLDILISTVLPHQKETMRSLLREAESRQDLPKPMERSASSSSGLSLSLATANVGQGVEDMRQRGARYMKNQHF
ncbi:RAB11-binding protein RELCH homolog isoform X2 [Belonocnema kinseyi]|uniref:RAB11-binding protein RELCH homolog isoform X2 n=1 Tax=Belonocnema kinseyi TaxID=2817044 RepID=UPI00143D8F47|nr:RAB11-binding protein RELCH homolog isoform X2 [Belonocnema kinseyi]